MVVPADLSQYYGSMSPQAAKVQQEYLVDPRNRYWPSPWTIITVIAILIAVAVSLLLR